MSASAALHDRREVAVFDFDGTLTHRDSLVPFLRFALPTSKLVSGLLRSSPALAGCALGRVTRASAKESLLGNLFRGMRERDLYDLGRRFGDTVVPRLLRQRALDRIDWHRDSGHRLVLASASLEAYLEPWALAAGFDDVLATRLECREGRVTGRILGSNCNGPEKVLRLRSLLGELDGYVIHGYGDSRGDQDLLQAVTIPHYREL